MLSVAKLTVGQEAYYEQEVAGGLDDYYAGRGESPGVWAGRGAEELGLAGVVHEGELGTLLRGFDPASGRRLRTPVRHRTITVERLDPETGKLVEEKKRLAPVAGFDLVFSCPKSVSLLHALTDDEEVRRAVSEAHEAAWRAALAYLEREACVTRRGEGGTIRERAPGFVCAAFRHRTSRAQDPHLHTHVIVANLARSPDREWRALDGNCLLRTYRLAAGYLYEAELRRELSRRLGVEWTEPVKGMAEIVGIPEQAMRAFSTRRRTLLEHMEARGGEGFRAARVAALATREWKEEVSRERLRREWRARAAEYGLGHADLRALLGRSPERAEPDLTGTVERLLGPHGLTARQTTFTEPELVCALAEAYDQGAPAEEIAALACSLASVPGLALVEPGSVPGRPARLTTRELLAVEREALALVLAGRNAGAPTVAGHFAARVLARNALSLEQQAFVREACLSPDRVLCVVGQAGVGKTTALSTLTEAFDRGGVPVLVAAPSGRAAEELHASAGIESATLHRLLVRAHAGDGLPRGCVLVVDEAGMAETRILAPLLRLVHEAEGKAILIGDPAQLPAVGAGGLFASLCERLGTIELTENRRQRNLDEHEALARLRAGEPEPYLCFAAERGRLHVADDPLEARARLLADWWQAAKSDLAGSVMLAYRRADVAELNEAARALLGQDGKLGCERLVIGEREFRPGDRVVCRRNCDLVGVRNGTRGTLEELDGERRALTVVTDGGERRTLPSWYVSAGFVEHGYALTGHAAQGATFERAFILARDEGALQEWGYVACSRARSETHLYLAASGHEREANGRSLEEEHATTRLADALTRSASERPALETADGRPDPREARRAYLEEAHARAEQRLCLARAELERLSWWERRRPAPELRSELAFRQAALDHARDCLGRFLRESREPHQVQARKPELSHARQILGRSREPTLTRPQREPTGIDLGW
jgi:conjugative relaxase-like TrwC/TraI family protein